MPDAPKPLYTATLRVNFPSTVHEFNFSTIEDANSVKKNLLIAIEAGAASFDIELESSEVTLLNLSQIQAISIVDLIANEEGALKALPYKKYTADKFRKAEEDAEDLFDIISFGAH